MLVQVVVLVGVGRMAALVAAVASRVLLRVVVGLVRQEALEVRVCRSVRRNGPER